MKKILMLSVLTILASCASNPKQCDERKSPVTLEQAASPGETPQERNTDLFKKRTETSPRRP